MNTLVGSSNQASSIRYAANLKFPADAAAIAVFIYKVNLWLAFQND